MNQPNQPNQLTLAQVVADFTHLPPLPEVVMELMDYLQSDDVDAEEVQRMLSQDQVLVAKSLRIANSSFYGLPRKVATIHDAIVVLGLRAVHTLVTTATVTSLFQSMHAALETAGYNQRAFWLHSIGTAFCARTLAREVAANPESAFAAGLLHDIGYLILAARFPEHFARMQTYSNQRDCLLLEAERTILGFDHAQIGAALAQRWNFAPEIHEAISWHHAPEEQTANSLAGIVHLADVMAHALNLSAEKAPLVPRLSTVVWNRLGLSWEDFTRLLGEVDAQFKDAELLFH